MKKQASEHEHIQNTKTRVLDAMLPHVEFDGWQDQTFEIAITDSGVNEALARLSFPKGAIDVATYFHKHADSTLIENTDAQTINSMRIRDRITHLIFKRLTMVNDHKEAVRRAVSLFSLPQHLGKSADAIWNTSDIIWKLVGDNSVGFTWASKRTSLGVVYSSSLLFWLGDDTENNTDTLEFIERRIENVMQFEKFKASINPSKLFNKKQMDT